MTHPGSAPITDIPTLPLRDMVVYPHGVHPLFVGTKKSIKALEIAMAGDKRIMLVAKRNSEVENPQQADLFEVGTVATVLQLLKLPDNTVKVLVEGSYRAHLIELEDDGESLSAAVTVIDDVSEQEHSDDAVLRSVMNQFEQFVEVSKKVPQEVLSSLSGIDKPGRLMDSIAAQMALRLEDRQAILESDSVDERMALLLALMESEIDLHRMEKRIRGRVKKQMEKSQREYYLNEQMKAIQKELGELEESASDIDELRAKIENLGLSKEAYSKALSEWNKLRQMPPMSAEATVVRSYLDWITEIPWKKHSRVRRDLKVAQQILDADHYGLEEVKDRIMEYLAVQIRVRKVKGPVLCLVGPPGVGKTSLGESLARATNRKYIRMALGGVRDEAEIRGHRRTYIGSMPGKIVQKMAKAKVRNPLFLLDEVDKMGMDMRGDPASALLEVLDPEQNNTFNDHYLEIDYDLSDVFFVCTSNSMNIPPALLDRMEIIRLPGYTEDEKQHIAQRYLAPKQKKLNGLADQELSIEADAILHLIRYYTREAGVRGLEREIAKICRKVVKHKGMDAGSGGDSIVAARLEQLIGVRKYNFGKAEEKNQIGMVTGLAWTQVGGELLNIEAVAVPGKGRQTKTGSLGDVMQESIQAAFTFVRSRCAVLGIAEDFHENQDIHIHVPEGATPKDGPSAGVGMCTAMVSVLTGIPVKAEVAMTGEITLRGQVLAVGGLKEKLLAARRGGISTVIIPSENERDLKEIPDNITCQLDIQPVRWMDEVLELALERTPKPKAAAQIPGSIKENNTGDEGISISRH